MQVVSARVPLQHAASQTGGPQPAPSRAGRHPAHRRRRRTAGCPGPTHARAGLSLQTAHSGGRLYLNPTPGQTKTSCKLTKCDIASLKY